MRLLVVIAASAGMAGGIESSSSSGGPGRESWFAPAEPGFASAEPGFALAEPGFAPAEPEFAPAEPGFALAEPGFAPAEPGFAPAEPGLASSAEPWFASSAEPGLASSAEPWLAQAAVRGSTRGAGARSRLAGRARFAPGMESAFAMAQPGAGGPPARAARPAGRGARPGAGRKPVELTAFEAEVATAINRLRREPAWLVGRLERYRARYQGDYLYLPGVDAPILTSEGVAAANQAIAAARRGKPRPELRLSAGLSRAARAHALEIGRAGTVDHSGRDGSEPHERMQRHGRVRGLSGENIGTGYGDAEAMVLGLFVDDGVPDRGHRVNLLESEFRVFGVGCARHGRFGTVCVIDFAGGFIE